MIRRGGLAAILVLALCAPCRAANQDDIAIADWVRAWPLAFHIRGTKSEPAYQEAIDVARDGDIFTITGGAPAWAQRSVEEIEVKPDGRLHHRICPQGMSCSKETIPSGFLASAALLGAVRQGKNLGTATPVPYGAAMVLCIPAERLGIVDPVLDPCFDRKTGAVLAQRHRLSGHFDGPSLDPWPVTSGLAESPIAERAR